MKNAFFLTLCLLAATSIYGQQEKSGYSLLWEVQSPQGKTSYLFGSMHSNDRRLFNLPDSVYYALDASEMIVLETDIFSIFESFDALRGGVDLKFDREGKPYTNNTRASMTAYGDENGMPQFLDAYFQQYCHNAGKEFLALETVDFQMDAFSEVTETADFEEGNYESFLSSKEDMIDLYLKGDIYGINEFVKSGLSIMPDSYQNLIVDRNTTMVEKLDPFLREKSVFCAVGAGHLASKGGVIHLLRERGYEVRRVSATYSDFSTVHEKSVRSFDSYDLLVPEVKMSLNFPGRPVEIELNDGELFHCVYRDLGQGNTYEVSVFNRAGTANWEDAAAEYLPGPEESPYEKITLPNGGEAIQGVSQEYWDNTLSWVRVLLTEDFVVVLSASGGNKFMNSPRAFRFFDTLNMW